MLRLVMLENVPNFLGFMIYLVQSHLLSSSEVCDFMSSQISWCHFLIGFELIIRSIYHNSDVLFCR